VPVLNIERHGLPDSTWIVVRVLESPEKFCGAGKSIPASTKLPNVFCVNEEILVIIRKDAAILPCRSVLPDNCRYEVLSTENFVGRHLQVVNFAIID
jgi:hypothetical protein